MVSFLRNYDAVLVSALTLLQQETKEPLVEGIAGTGRRSLSLSISLHCWLYRFRTH
jgi:hypothetical protein